MFYGDLGLYKDFGGVVLSDEETQGIVNALGGKKALVLQNHGLLTVGGCIESAVGWFIVYVFGRCSSSSIPSRDAPGGSDLFTPAQWARI